MNDMLGVLYWFLIIVLGAVAYFGIIAVGYSLLRMHLDEKRIKKRTKAP